MDKGSVAALAPTPERLPAGPGGMLDVRIARKTFHATDGGVLEAVADLAFTAKPGSFTTLIGPSGCGKTTVLRIILGLDGDYEGHVRLPAANGPVAAVFQEPRLLPWRDVETNVRLVLASGDRKRDLSPLFEVLGLAELRTRFPGELSLGLARRVALARAFATEPALLLLDEPFVSLDETTAARLRQLLLDVWSARPTTVLMVTHNLREAVELSDRILFLTPRPARLRGVYPISEPHAHRSPAWRDRVLSEIDGLYPGVL